MLYKENLYINTRQTYRETDDRQTDSLTYIDEGSNDPSERWECVGHVLTQLPGSTESEARGDLRGLVVQRIYVYQYQTDSQTDRQTDRQTSMKGVMIPVNIENALGMYWCYCLSTQNLGPEVTLATLL